MGLFSLILVLAADDPGEGLAKKMLLIYRKDAAEYSIAVESAPEEELEFKKEPVLEWSNPVREAQGQGVVFLWLREGRPSAFGCVYSQRVTEPQGRRVIHEFHALDREKLLVRRPGRRNQWEPQAGLERKELPDADPPAATRGARLVQMRRLAQEFTGHETDGGANRWELRLLPAPLYRYSAARSGVTDGALFTLVSTEGTDPEVLLILEARETDGQTRWEYACGRFGGRNMHVQRKGKEVWSSILNGRSNIWAHDPLHLYRTYHEKIVTPEGEVISDFR